MAAEAESADGKRYSDKKIMSGLCPLVRVLPPSKSRSKREDKEPTAMPTMIIHWYWVLSVCERCLSSQ